MNQPSLFELPRQMSEPMATSLSVAPFQHGSHSSWTGAQTQDLPLWTDKQKALLDLLGAGHPLTRNQIALFLLWPLSSVCSVLDSVRDQIEFVDYETVRWDTGGTFDRVTRRERFQLKKKQETFRRVR